MPKKLPPSRRNTDGSPEGIELSERLARLKSRLDDPETVKLQQVEDPDSPENVHNRAGLAQAFRLSSEFIAGVVVGAGIGYGIDTFFGTSPWGLIIFLLLGFGAAVLNVLRAAGMVAESEMRLKSVQELSNRQQDEETRGRDEK
ncbi:MAG: AtpZ/AtpI family protein [Rhizobiaceae bacterium]